MKEEWREIENTNGKYLVSNMGGVKSTSRYEARKDRWGGVGLVYIKGRILKCRPDKNGYLLVHINGISKKVHRLVAMAFLRPIADKNVVNHKDGNKQNNEVSNLEWCTGKENSRHASMVLSAFTNCHGKSIMQYTTDNVLIRQYPTIAEASRIMHVSKAAICESIKENRPCKGYIYKYTQKITKQKQIINTTMTTRPTTHIVLTFKSDENGQFYIALYKTTAKVGSARYMLEFYDNVQSTIALNHKLALCLENVEQLTADEYNDCLTASNRVEGDFIS